MTAYIALKENMLTIYTLIIFSGSQFDLWIHKYILYYIYIVYIYIMCTSLFFQISIELLWIPGDMTRSHHNNLRVYDAGISEEQNVMFFFLLQQIKTAHFVITSGSVGPMSTFGKVLCIFLLHWFILEWCRYIMRGRLAIFDNETPWL